MLVTHHCGTAPASHVCLREETAVTSSVSPLMYHLQLKYDLVRQHGSYLSFNPRPFFLILSVHDYASCWWTVRHMGLALLVLPLILSAETCLSFSCRVT